LINAKGACRILFHFSCDVALGLWRQSQAQEAYMTGKLSVTASGCFAAVVASFTALGQPGPRVECCFAVKSESMVPTLEAGLSVAAFRYSDASQPQPGDIIAFLYEKKSSIDIKRLIGVPGDHIQMIAGALHLNGQPVKRERVDDFPYRDQSGRTISIKRWRETLPNSVQYDTLDMIDNGFYDNTPIYAVPSGHFFVMADNRDNGIDSRVLTEIGYVPFNNIIGRAVRR
jgi:signal peptidase I